MSKDMKKLIFFLLFLLLIFHSVYAQRLFVTDNLLTEKVYPGSIAVFELNIRNNQNTQDTFLITPDEFSIAPFSDIFESIEIEKGQIQIKPNSVAKVLVRIRMFDDIKPGKNYKTFVKVASVRNPNLKVNHDLTVSVSSPEEVIYITTDLLDKVVPGRTLTINIDLKNKINLILDNVDIFVDSELFKKNIKLKLFPYQDTRQTVNFDIEPTASPEKYTLIVTATQKNKLIGSFVKDFEIIKNPNINERIIKDVGFLSSTINLVKSNNGNLVVKEAFTLEINAFKRLFTKYNVEPDKIEDGKVEWTFELKPGDSFTIKAETDYRALFVFILALLIFLAVMWYLYGKRVTIRKAIFKVKDEKGGVSEIKVLLHIKNRLTNLKDVEVLDVVPNFVKPRHEFGTLQPAKIQRGPRGIRILWNIPELLEGEERVLSYEIESQLHIIGKLVLPRAKVRYRRKNKVVEVSSNKLTFFSTKER